MVAADAGICLSGSLFCKYRRRVHEAIGFHVQRSDVWIGERAGKR